MKRKVSFVSNMLAAVGAGVMLTSLAHASDRPAANTNSARPANEGGIAGGTTNGPDVIVSSLASQVSEYGVVGDIAAYAMTTVSCNLGDQDAEWFAGSPDHPVIAQNIYRLKGGRFEQVGMSWLKHGWCAADAPSCGSPYEPVGSCSWLGTHATDTYTASLNADQFDLGPRSEVNPWTGGYVYPYVKNWNLTGNCTFKRAQVLGSDLDAALNVGAVYFAESQYVCTDEPAINRYNNVSYRGLIAGNMVNSPFCGGGGQQRDLNGSGGIFAQQPAINAWRAADPGVVLTNIDVPNDGRFIIGVRATNSGGLWHYEYALYNMNSDRAAQSFSVPVPGAVTVENVGFHDIFYHSGETFSSVDWTPALSGGAHTWATDPITTNADANALRWGTVYNFRFDSPFPPKHANATIGLFKTGTPASLTVKVLGPTDCPADTSPNGVGDGAVDVNDLLAVITGWGACPNGNDCPPDVAPDGGNDTVDVNDLLRVITSWGACP